MPETARTHETVITVETRSPAPSRGTFGPSGRSSVAALKIRPSRMTATAPLTMPRSTARGRDVIRSAATSAMAPASPGRTRMSETPADTSSWKGAMNPAVVCTVGALCSSTCGTGTGNMNPTRR